MGDIADEMLARYGYFPDDALPQPEDYLHMTDDELRAATAGVRDGKIWSIRRCQYALSQRQRWCLAAWLAKRDGGEASM